MLIELHEQLSELKTTGIVAKKPELKKQAGKARKCKEEEQG